MNILFVCHGNICRSPMAEFIMKDLLRKNGISGVCVESCATSTEELGNPVYPPARAELQKHGISCAGKTARQITKADYAKFDLILCMDSMNLRNLFRIIGDDPEHKVRKLMDYVSGGDVADPWYTGNFTVTYADILSACTALLKTIS